MSFGICTSCYNWYDRYLIRWAKSIAKLNIKPIMVTVVQSGTRYNIKNFVNAEKILMDAKISYKFHFINKHTNMGNVRNKAVEICYSKFIMYLDIDDEITSNATKDFEKYNNFDVICGGMKIIEFGKRNKYLKFKKVSNKKLLGLKYWISSHSIFRKSLWNKYKYLNSEFCNAFLWITFANAGALFIGTNEIFTIYNKDKNGHCIRYTKKNIEKWDCESKELLIKLKILNGYE